MKKPYKKINIDEEYSQRLDLVCFFQQTTKKKFIEDLIDKYLEKHPIPKKLEIENYKLKIVK